MNRIKELRKEQSLTLSELANDLGISDGQLSNYENGKRSPRDNRIWDELSEIFDCEVAYLMGLTANKKKRETVSQKVTVDLKIEWLEFENNLAAKLNELSETHEILEVHYAAVSSSDWMVMSGGNTMALVKAKRFK